MQFTVSNFVGPELTDIASSLTCIAVMVLVMKLWTPRNVMHLEGDRPPASTAAPSWTPQPAMRVEGLGNVAVAVRRHSAADIFSAWMPYLLLVAFVLVWGEADVKAAINRWTNSLLPSAIPRSTTLLNGLLVPGLHNMIQRVPPVVAQPSPYAAVFEFNWLSASGTSCFLATIVAAVLLRVSPARFGRIYAGTFKQLALPILTIACMLALAYLMNYSGMTSTLGLSLAATGPAFPFFSAVLGWLGVFLTGSDTSANALFGNLQVVTANALHLNPVLTAAVNSAAGVMGKMISIQSIAVAVAATGMTTADEGRLFRFTIKHSVFLMAVMGVLSLLFAYVFAGYVPSP
jgi:lactate permease